MSQSALDQAAAHEVLHILRQAVLVNAEDVRFTAYQPANEVGIRYKQHTSDGRPRYVPGPIETYSGGSKLVRALIRCLCGVDEEVCLDEDPPIAVNLLPQWAERLGIKAARVVNSPMRGAGASGYICVLTFEYNAITIDAARQVDFVRAARNA